MQLKLVAFLWLRSPPPIDETDAVQLTGETSPPKRPYGHPPKLRTQLGSAWAIGFWALTARQLYMWSSSQQMTEGEGKGGNLW